MRGREQNSRQSHLTGFLISTGELDGDECKGVKYSRKEGREDQGCFLKNYCQASLVAQWQRICLPMQETQVRSLVQEDPTCFEATEPVSHSDGACVL